MATKAKTSKKVAKATAPAPKVEFKTTEGLSILQRGAIFLSLRNAGLSVAEIAKGYTKKGEKFTPVAVYQAVRLAETPKAVRDLVKSGAVKATGVLPLLKGQNKEDEKVFNARLIQQVQDMAAQRQKRSDFLAKNGFEGGTKLTKARTLTMVGKRLASISANSPALQSARVQAVKTLIDLLNQRATVDEILQGLSQEEKPAKAPKAKKAAAKKA